MVQEEEKKTYPDGRRCTIDLTPAAAEEVDRICNMFDLKISDLFRYSLLLMRIYADATREGKQMRLVNRKDPNEIQVVELLSLKATSNINGDIVARKLAIEPGAKFTGNCSMTSDSEIQNAPKEPEKPAQEQGKAK